MIIKRQEERGLVFWFWFVIFVRKKNNLRIMSMKKAPPRLLQVLALTFFPSSYSKSGVSAGSRIPSPTPVNVSTHVGPRLPESIQEAEHYTSYKNLLGFSEKVLQHLAKPSCFRRRKHWAVPGQKKGRHNKAGRLKKNATKTSMHNSLSNK